MKRMIPVDDFIGLIDKLRESAYFMHSDNTESRTIDWQDAEGILLIFREQNVIEFDDDGCPVFWKHPDRLAVLPLECFCARLNFGLYFGPLPRHEHLRKLSFVWHPS